MPAVDKSVKTIRTLRVLASTVAAASAPMACRPPFMAMINATIDMLTACPTIRMVAREEAAVPYLSLPTDPMTASAAANSAEPTPMKWPMLWWIGMEKLYRILPWKKTAWTCAAFPIEMMWIYDIFPDHPENMATVAAARKQSQRLIEHAESMGFSRDL